MFSIQDYTMGTEFHLTTAPVPHVIHISPVSEWVWARVNTMDKLANFDGLDDWSKLKVSWYSFD